MQAQPEEIKKTPKMNTETVDILQKKLKSLKMNDFKLQKDFIPQYKENELNMMESLILEKFYENKEFKNIENIIFKNSEKLVDIYLKENINEQLLIENQNKKLKWLALLALILSIFLPKYVLNTPTEVTSIIFFISLIIYLKNTSLLFYKTIYFLSSFIYIAILGIYNKFKFSAKISKKISPEDMIKITKLFTKEQVAYGQTYLLNAGLHKNIDNFSSAFKKIEDNIKICWERIENNKENNIYISCLTIIEYGLMIKYLCNNYDRYLIYKDEVEKIEKEISQKVKLENNLEDIYNKL